MTGSEPNMAGAIGPGLECCPFLDELDIDFQEPPEPKPTERSPGNTRWFNRKKEAADMRGVLYERHMSAMLFLRGINDTDGFHLATNMEGMGAFDDNVLIYQQNGTTRACFIQQKHNQRAEKGEGKPNPGLSRAFSFRKVMGDLLKYYTSYQQVMDKLPNLTQQFGIGADDIEFVFYTNVNLDKKRGDLIPQHILSTGGRCFCYSIETDKLISTFFEELVIYNDFLHELQTQKLERDELEKNIDNLRKGIHSKEIVNRLYRIKFHPNFKCEIDRALQEIHTLVDRAKFERFLSKLKMFHCQASESDLLSLIRYEFNRACGMTDNEMISVMDNFMRRIDSWSETGNCYLTAESSLWQAIQKDIVATLNEPKIRDLRELNVTFVEEQVAILRQCVLENSIVSVVTDGSSVLLSLSKLCQAVNDRNCLVVSLDTLIQHQETVMQAWSDRWCPVLVLESDGRVLDDELEAMSRTLCYAMGDAQRTLVLVGCEGNALDNALHRELGNSLVHHQDSSQLVHLDPQSQQRVHNTLLNFQGYPVHISTLLEQDIELARIISGDILMKLLDSPGDIVIGNKFSSQVNCYIPRTLNQKRIVKKDVLHHQQPLTLFVISTAVPDTITKYLLPVDKLCQCRYNKTYILCDCRFIAVNDPVEDEQKLLQCLQHDHRTVHWLQADNNGVLKWRWSKGDTSLLQDFIEDGDERIFHPRSIADVPDKVVLIVAEPGMGKSTLLNHLANETKRVDPASWVVKLNFSEHTHFLDASNFHSQDKAIELLENATGLNNRNSHPFGKTLLRHCVNTSGNVSILLDGFDEITPTYTCKGLQLLDIYKGTQAKKLWITSRAISRKQLESALSTLPFALQCFNEKDQKYFLMKCWESNVPDKVKLGKFVTAILDLVQKSLGYHDKQFTGIPLQIMMLAEAFQPELKKYITSGIIMLPSQINLIQLYDRFVAKKCEIFLRDKLRINITNPMFRDQFRVNKINLYKEHITLAMVLLLSQDELINFGGTIILEKYNSLMTTDFKNIGRVGIINDVHNGKPNFVHRTFAEYFVASWLMERYGQMKKFNQMKLFDPSFRMVRIMFDRMLCKNYILHNAVLNGEIDKMRALIEAGADVNATDGGGRTPLHLAALCDAPDACKLLLQHGAMVEIRDRVLNWRPFRYADQMGSWKVIEILLQTKNTTTQDILVTTNIIHNELRVESLLKYAVKEGYVNLLRLILSTRIKYSNVLDHEGNMLVHIAAKFGKTEMMEFLLRYKAATKKYGRQGRSILRYFENSGFSTATRLLDNITLKVDIKNSNGCSLLHLAAREGHKDTVAWLLHAGADMDVTDEHGCTALHLAARGGHLKVVDHLVQSGANVNIMNSFGSTPLHMAARVGHLSVVKHLAEVMNVNVTNKYNSTPLHLACKGGHTEIVAWLVSREDTSLNALDKFGHMPIHKAVKAGHIDTVKCLVEAGCDIDVQNSKVSLLQVSIEMGHTDIVRCLVKAGIDTTRQDSNGVLPLVLAAKRGDSKSVQYLLNCTKGCCQ